MAKITRQTHKIFGLSGSSDNFAKFGSLVAGSPIKTKDIATIQSLPAWEEGFQSSIFGANKDILLEDLNSFSFEHSRQLAYLFQAGIAEWDAATEYSIGSLVQLTTAGDATGNVYMSLIDVNVGNALPTGTSNANWRLINPPNYIVGSTATPGALPVVESLTPVNGMPASVTLKNSQVSEDGVNVAIGLPLKFPDNTTQGTAAAPITAQANQTGFRALATTYQNTTGKAMFVSVTLGGPAGGDGAAQAVTDSNPAPTTIVARQGVASTAAVSPMQLFFIVLAGNYYKVSNIVGAYTMTSWIEWS